MSVIALGLAVCAVVGVVALVGLLTAVLLMQGRRGREGLERYRAACRALGLHQTPEYWVGEIDGTWVGTSSVQYRVRAAPILRLLSQPLLGSAWLPFSVATWSWCVQGSAQPSKWPFAPLRGSQS